MQPTLATIERMLRRELPRLKDEYGVASLALFGSRARRQGRADSDLDVLVTFDRVPGLLRFIALELHLSELLDLKVDLVLRESLKPAVRDRILPDMVSV